MGNKLREASDPSLKAIQLDKHTTVYVNINKSEADVRQRFAERHAGNWDLGYFDTYERQGNKMLVRNKARGA
jgi:hypothetical protein